MSSPQIGITAYRHHNPQGYPLISLNEAYVQAVSQAGGTPIIIPLGLSEIQFKTLFQNLDGIVFSGGGDIDPHEFGGDSHPQLMSVDSDRDRVEIQLCRDSVQNGLPILGICRGLQTINVALGGTLYTHLPEQFPGDIHHPHIEGNPRDFLAHEVRIQPQTDLHHILGASKVMVNSMHHQGIHNLAPGLEETAHAPDGLIEAISLSGHPYGVAVQWHPECLTAHETMRALFQSLIWAAS